jgi:hypothetical protein
MANLAESSSAVVLSVRFHGVALNRVEVGWSSDDQPGTVRRHIQRWTGPGVTRLSTQTLRDGRSLKDVLAEEVAGELLGLSMIADLPKSEMQHVLNLANDPESHSEDAALEIDGTSTAGVVLPLLATPIGNVGGAAVRHGQDTIVVIHGGEPNSGISLRTTAGVDDVQ